MNVVKYFFGILLLAVAIYLLTRILPSPIIMGLWAALLVFSGIFTGALVPAHSHHEKFKQASGIILLIYGLLILVGASMGSSNPLQPLAAWSHSAPQNITALPNQMPTTIDEVQTALTNAFGKPVMIDFYADWCTTCKTLEATTLKDPEIMAALKNFIILKIDVTANNQQNKALLSKYNVIAPPTFLFVTKQSEELLQLRLVGDVTRNDFLKSLNFVSSYTRNP